MESEDGDLEDGEIVDYTPLERPPLPAVSNFANGVSAVSSDEASLPSSDTDDDSDTEPYKRPKKQKLSKQRYRFSNNKTSNKYNVWSIGLQEEALTETLVKCDVDRTDRSRDVESYDYTIKFRLGDDPAQEQIRELEQEEDELRKEHSRSNKRRHGEFGKQRHIRHRSRDKDGDRHSSELKYVKRTIDDLAVTDADPTEEVAKDICAKLTEAKEELILRVVTILGNKKAIEIYNETKHIEEDGGMMVMNGSRRRTPGGVYLLLVKRDSDIPPENIKKIFLSDKEMTQQFRKKKKKNVKEMSKSLLGDELLPNLLTRSEELELKLRNRTPDVPESEPAVTNPPPSPATDCDGADTLNVPTQQIVSYDDDFLQLNVDDNEMELF